MVSSVYGTISESVEQYITIGTVRLCHLLSVAAAFFDNVEVGKVYGTNVKIKTGKQILPKAIYFSASRFA